MTSMRVAYGDTNVLRCSVQFAYDRFFADFGYTDTHQVPINGEFLPSNPKLFSQISRDQPKQQEKRGGQGGLALGTTTNR